MTGDAGSQPEMLTYNINHAFPEAIVRSLRKGLLGERQYEALKSVSNIGEFKLNLEDTDYGADLFAGMDGNMFEVQALRRAMKEKLFKEINYILGQSVYPLNAFLVRMLHSYQIDNVIYMIEGLKSGRAPEELLKLADPLGMFKELKLVQPIGDGDDYQNLYQNVLIDLPVGDYFRKFLEEETAAAYDENMEQNIHFISEVMKDYSLDQIQLRVKKIWLQDFHAFCMTELPETSAAVMDDLLKFESDSRTIQIIANSLSFRDLRDARGRETYRTKFICNLGYLYPQRYSALKEVADAKGLKEALADSDYDRLIENINLSAEDNRHEADSNEPKLDEVMAAEAARKYSMAFENAFHFGAFYAYLKLKEMEIKNVTWLSDLVSMNLSKNSPGWNKYTVPFMYHVNQAGQYER